MVEQYVTSQVILLRYAALLFSLFIFITRNCFFLKLFLLQLLILYVNYGLRLDRNYGLRLDVNQSLHPLCYRVFPSFCLCFSQRC